MTNADLVSQLEQFDAAWAEAPEEDSYENLPDGKYQVSIQEVRFENAKNSGRLQLAWVFEVLNSGPNMGRKLFHYRGLDKEESVGWMKKEIYTCGLRVEKVSELPEMLDQLLDRVVEITLKTKKKDGQEYQNCFINKLLDEPNFDARDEDVPF
jgi:hypothetical protein